MNHKADISFFDAKKPWSERKDRILGEYITAYLPKIATQRFPVFVVDGFAGPGFFADGKEGSPLILARAIRAAKLNVGAKLLCIEKNNELFRKLQENLAPFEFAETQQGTFSDSILRIAEVGHDHSVFLYVDPYTVEGLAWSELDQVFENLRTSRMSVEILLNFNAASFLRRGLAALHCSVPTPDPEEEGIEEIEAATEDAPSLQHLDIVLDGNEWQAVARSSGSFADRVSKINEVLIQKLRDRFREVCFHPVLAKPHHRVPKYFLVFASRHHDALQLMNDAMAKSLKTLAAMAEPRDGTLFELRPVHLVPDQQQLTERILKLAERRMQRKQLMLSVIRAEFGRHLWKEIRGVIEELLKSKRLQSSTGKTRINDTVEIWRVKM